MPVHERGEMTRSVQARLLRREPTRRWSEIAHRCGFADQSHLSREFKRLVQVTPGSYARALRGRTRRPSAGRAATRPSRS